MNGPGMFKVKPYYDYSKAQIELPTCMFKMKNVHDNSCSNNVIEEEDAELAALECRQESILQELKVLESEVTTLAVKLKLQDDGVPVTHKTLQSSTKTQSGHKKGGAKLATSKSVPIAELGNVIHDIVIYANPNSPPLSLFVLYHTLSSQYRCRTAVHIHSSVKNVPEKLLQSLANGVEVGRGEAQIGITLIWKDVLHGPELKVSAHSQTPIQGEANVARYLARLITPRYDAGTIQHVCAVDDLLDLASFTILGGSSKERAAALRSLNSLLGKNTWLAPSGEMSIADAVVWSTLHQVQMTSGTPSNVQKWLKACEAQSAFKCALDIL
ncbi:aminoacyl tRNA synthase complex-interacting multifunctional protein 2-like [Amphiura filiformis]|uniref:aminoacyl tRNA synthase complex-interacting multifunctional protein 2-like n=1 Tax=Amphiura filiformis TaxID=82378 RepID=UPI003B213769